MPDLARERRDRSRQSLDQRVTFDITSDERNVFGETVSVVETWDAWGRRDDADIDDTFALDVGGTRDTGTVRLVVRHDARIVAGPCSLFTVHGTEYRITSVEEIGRQRYMRLAGVKPT